MPQIPLPYLRPVRRSGLQPVFVRPRYRLPFGLRLALLTVIHLVVFSAVYYLAFVGRFDFPLPAAMRANYFGTLPWILGVKVLVFYARGQFHGWWSYVTFADLSGLVVAATVASLLIVTLSHFGALAPVPRIVLALDYVFTLVVFSALRGAWRSLREQFWPWWRRDPRRATLLVGADQASGLLASQINSHQQLGYRITGLLATDREPAGKRLGPVRVLGPVDRIRQLAAAHAIQDVLCVAGSLSGGRLRQLMAVCREAEISLRIIAPIGDLFSGSDQVPVRDIEITDLLQREPVQWDGRGIGELLGDRRVLVTGAGGSIGSEICRQVASFGPRELVLLGRGENRIFAIHNQLRAQRTNVSFHPVIGDITDEETMGQVFERYRPEIVFHAAAHKHVPLMEANVAQAVKNNVRGTRLLADLADEWDVKHFVLISTDKAVNPTSVMGATKQLAERYVYALSHHTTTRYVAVRFGNVLGSAGSVVPIFQSQIRAGGPITVTDRRMTRYFMTIPEASQLVLQAAAMGAGGEIFVLDMGEPVRVVDMAREMVRLSGLPSESIGIRYVGMRDGEKLYEELHGAAEQLRPTAHPRVNQATPAREAREQLVAAIDELTATPADQIRKKLSEIVPEFGEPSKEAPESEPSSADLQPDSVLSS